MPDAALIVTALGGFDNILDVMPCMTRLRVEVRNPLLVDTTILKQAGAFGVVQSGAVVQVVVGQVAADLSDEIGELR